MDNRCFNVEKQLDNVKTMLECCPNIVPIQHCYLGSYLRSLFQYREQTRDLPTRGDLTGRLVEPIFSRNNSGNRCFSYAAPRLYNKLPIEIRNAPNINIFKNNLKTFLFRKAYDLESQTVVESYRVT